MSKHLVAIKMLPRRFDIVPVLRATMMHPTARPADADAGKRRCRGCNRQAGERRQQESFFDGQCIVVRTVVDVAVVVSTPRTIQPLGFSKPMMALESGTCAATADINAMAIRIGRIFLRLAALLIKCSAWSFSSMVRNGFGILASFVRNRGRSAEGYRIEASRRLRGLLLLSPRSMIFPVILRQAVNQGWVSSRRSADANPTG